MDRDQSEVVEDSYRPSLRNFLLNKCKILKVRTGNAEEDVRCNTRKCPLELKRWPIFNLLDSKFISQIHTVMIFGDAKAAIIVTRDKMVHALGTNNNGRLGFESKEYKTLHPEKIETLCGKNITKFVCCSQMCSAFTEEGKLPMEEKILDIAAAYLGDSSAAFCSDGHIYMWGYWFGEKILKPVVTKFSNIYDVFTYNVPYTTYNFMSADEHEHACETSNILKSLETVFDDSDTSDFIIEVEVGQKRITELLALSNVYCETKLKKHCSELIKPRITVSNVILVYKTALQCSVKDLEECSFQFILNHSTVVFLKEFVNLDYDMQLDLTLKVAKAHGFKT